ncbi:MAG: methyltransferase domain-containing protein [Bacteroidia bacterium]
MPFLKKIANKFINPPVKKILSINFFWKLCTPVLFFSKYLTHQRNLVFTEDEKKKNELLARNMFQNLVVKNGSFRGMKYPEFQAIWSTLYSKLLGSYECELNNIIENCCRENYTQIIDVGCAEGYYAVGFAMRVKKAHVFACDINEKALEQCEKMAKLNGVSDRISYEKKCNPEMLSNFKFDGKGLLIIDCEGYEYELLSDKKVCEKLKNCDIIIELHDYTKNYIIENNFRNTHQFFFIESVDDFQKAKKYQYKELDSLGFYEKKYILEERRQNIMEWIFIKSNYQTDGMIQ